MDIQALEKELLTLWKTDEDGKVAQTRACTLNLVVCVPDQSTAEQITAAVLQLTATHPNRTLMLIADRSTAGERLEAYVQANCVLAAPGVPQVCGEQITVHAQGSAISQLPGLVLSLLLPDLPVILWVMGEDGLNNTLIERLRNVADRLIIDSADFADQSAGLLRLAQLGEELQAQRHKVSVNDLNWNRLTPWRELTAQFFDTRPLLPHLRRIDRVEIHFGATENTEDTEALVTTAVPSEASAIGTKETAVDLPPSVPSVAIPAILFGAWLASSLGWSYQRTTQSANELTLEFIRPAVTSIVGDQRVVTMVLRPAAGGPAGLLMQVRLACVDNVRAEFSVERTEDPTCARTIARADGEPTIGRLAQLGRNDMSELLSNELRMSGIDHTFQRVLHLARQVVASR
jgi:glucose-6-phosphate dehydrogenase assembly protein OpcA